MIIFRCSYISPFALLIIFYLELFICSIWCLTTFRTPFTFQCQTTDNLTIGFQIHLFQLFASTNKFHCVYSWAWAQIWAQAIHLSASPYFNLNLNTFTIWFNFIFFSLSIKFANFRSSMHFQSHHWTQKSKSFYYRYHHLTHDA